MIKRSLAACLLASAAVVPALAQSTTSPAPSAQAPANQATPAPPADPGRFLNTPGPNQWRLSRLIGVNIYGFDNGNPSDRDRIGDVSEVILDRSGRIEAVVIGVGGFLGIGEKNVAVPFTAVEWRLSDRPHNRPDGLAARSDATPEPTGAGATPASRPAEAPATGAGAARNEVNQGYPDRGYIRMSKADLQNAPTFRYGGEASRDGNRTSNPNSNVPVGAPR